MKTSRKTVFLSMASTALLLALVWSATFPQSALAAITTQWDAATGTLTITSDGSDNIVITSENNDLQYDAVLVNGNWDIFGTGHSVLSKDVKKIIVQGGPGDNLIDLRGVGPYHFVNLASDTNSTEIYGRGGNDTMYGSDFKDTMSGGNGNDEMHGGAGNDAVNGGAGNDTFIETPGSADIVNDSGGDDTLDFSGAAFAITIDLDLQNVDQVVDAAGNTVQMQGQFEHFIGSAFDDTVSLDPLNVPRNVDGGAGNDTLNFNDKGLTATNDGTTITVPGYAPVTYASFETVDITSESWYLYLPLILR